MLFVTVEFRIPTPSSKSNDITNIELRALQRTLQYNQKVAVGVSRTRT